MIMFIVLAHKFKIIKPTGSFQRSVCAPR